MPGMAGEEAAPDPGKRRSAEAEAALAKSRRRRRLAMIVPPAAILAILLVGEVAARLSGARPVRGLAAAGERGWAPAPGGRISASGTTGPEGAPGGVLLVGDETALGAELADGETLGAAVARETGQPATLAACEGYGTQQELLWIRELAPRLKPSAVVVVFAFDDPRTFAGTIFTTIRFGLQRVSALAASAFPGSRPATRDELHDLYDPEEVPWRLFKQTLRQVGAWSRENKTPVILAIWPVMSKQDQGLEEFSENVRGAAREAGLETRFLLDDLGANDLESLKLPSGLPNAEAVKRAAKGIAKAVKGEE